jgi:hypothetical protein
MAASDNRGGGRQFAVIDDHADAIAFGTNKLKSHRQSDRRYEINRIKQLACRVPAIPILTSPLARHKKMTLLT